MSVIANDNTQAVLEAIKQAKVRALERFGLKGEDYAQNLCPVDTGNLRNSITHRVDTANDKTIIGVPHGKAAYGIYVELGTGVYAEGGRPTSWVYQDDMGNWHHTKGNKAQPFLKPAVANHAQTYLNIAKDEFKNG